MGRRPLAKQAPAQVPTAGFTPGVQKQVDAIADLVLAEFHKQLKARIEAGEMAEMDLSKLMQELGRILKSVKGPATSITAIQIPGHQQVTQEPKRVKAIEDAAMDPARLDALRKSADNFLEEDDG